MYAPASRDLLSPSNRDKAKGILILLVILDHNDFVRALFPWFFDPLNYHVLGFLFLLFLAPIRQKTSIYFLDRFVRYFVPFFVFYGASCVIYFSFLEAESSPLVFAFDALTGAIVGSAQLVKRSSGYLMFWFLPALFGISVVLGMFDALPKKWQHVLLPLFLLIHLLVGLVPISTAKYVPFGILIVGYIFILGLIVRRVFREITVRPRAPFLIGFLCLYVFTYSASWLYDTHIEIGSMNVDSIFTADSLVIHDLLAIGGFFVVLLVSPYLERGKFIAALGRCSLIVYLTHPFIFYAFKETAGLYWSISEGWTLDFVALTLASVCVVTLLSYLIAAFIARITWLHDLITPATAKEWLPVRVLRKP